MRTSDRPLNVLGKLFDELLRKYGCTTEEFCRASRMSRSYFSKLKRRPPSWSPSREAVQRWVESIGIASSSPDAQALYEASQLAFAPAWVQELIEHLRKQREKQRPRRSGTRRR